MLIAERRGKVPDFYCLEDVLTSNVFGLLNYIENPAVLLEILNQAETLSRKRFIDCIEFDLANYTSEFVFWKKMGKFGEPDLIIEFNNINNQKLILCIEVKYYSGKSSGPDEDQLCKYFEGLLEIANDTDSFFLGIIYLTKYPAVGEINDSLSSIQSKCSMDAKERLFQMRWTDVAEALKKARNFELTETERLIIEDLQGYLQYKNLVKFSGFSFVDESFDMQAKELCKSRNFVGFSFLENGIELAK